ncbi:unnamed protein product [Camellia sinensis]
MIQTPFSLPFTLFLSFYSRLPLAIRPTILLCSALLCSTCTSSNLLVFLAAFRVLEATWRLVGRDFSSSLSVILLDLHFGLSVSNMDLPLDVIREILGHSSIEEAVKTSILSENPIYAKNWSRHTDVVVDSNFWEEHSTRNQLDPGAVAEIVSGILYNHKGPIRKLILCIPRCLVEVVPVIRYDWVRHINKWLFSLHWNDIDEIILYNYNDETYKISFLYALVNLTRLVLGNCIFYQPFGGFRNLHCIRLDNIDFGSEIVGTVTYNFPNLTFFKAVNCSGFRHLKIEAPNLERFNVCATNGDETTMYKSGEIGLKRDTKSVKGVVVFDEGLVYLIGLSILRRPQKEETCPELEPNSRKWSRRFPSRKMIRFRKLNKCNGNTNAVLRKHLSQRRHI